MPRKSVTAVKTEGKMLSYEEAKSYARTANIKTFREWFDHCREGLRPPNIPGDPSTYYKETGWIGWGEFLNTGRASNAEKNKEGYFKSYEETKLICVKWGIRTIADWREFARSGQRRHDIPAAPDVVYKDKGWTRWSEFLAPKYLKFEEARLEVRKLNLTGNKGWRAFSGSGERPSNIPANPERVYKDQWTSWPDFLGSDRKPRSRTKC